MIPVCNRKRQSQIYCQPFYGKFADLVFIHDNYHTIGFETYSEVVNRQSEDILWTSNQGFPELCVKREEIDPIEEIEEVPEINRQIGFVVQLQSRFDREYVKRH
jgi:hypothetical protein